MGICPVGPMMIHLDKLTDMSCEITMATLQNKTNATEMVGKKGTKVYHGVVNIHGEEQKVPSPAED